MECVLVCEPTYACAPCDNDMVSLLPSTEPLIMSDVHVSYCSHFFSPACKILLIILRFYCTIVFLIKLVCALSYCPYTFILTQSGVPADFSSARNIAKGVLSQKQGDGKLH